VSRAGVITAIESALGTVTNPAFTMTYIGEPLSVPTTPMAAFWLSQHREDFTTLGDSSTVAEFTIRAYWRMQASPNMRETIEAEMWDAVVGIKTALRADSALGGNATDSRPGDASFGYIEIGGAVFRIATIPFEVNIYGESPITP
jgi:hypothetical protein